MIWRSRSIWLLFAMIDLASVAAAQKPQLVRLTVASAAGNEQWQGYLERVTRDSLFLRVRGSDTVAAFSRTVVPLVERAWPVHFGRSAAIGCAALGLPLGALGLYGTHDPDEPGLDRAFAVFALVVGCGVGALGGVVVSAVRRHEWEPWVLPDELP